MPTRAFHRAQQIACRFLPQRTRFHHRRQQYIRRRMLAPVFEQFIRFEQGQRVYLAFCPSRSGNDLAEKTRPVGDSAHSAAG